MCSKSYFSRGQCPQVAFSGWPPATQSVITGPPAAAESLLEIQRLRPHPGLSDQILHFFLF